jgi:hypothetical protein
LPQKKIIPAAHFCCQKSNFAAQKNKNVAAQKITLLPKVTNLLPILQIAIKKWSSRLKLLFDLNTVKSLDLVRIQIVTILFDFFKPDSSSPAYFIVPTRNLS